MSTDNNERDSGEGERVEIPFTVELDSQSWEVDSDGAMRTDDEFPHEFQPFEEENDGE